MVDFPSWGSEEMKPMTFLELTALLFQSTTSLMERIASAKRQNGELSTAQHMSGPREIVLWSFKPSPKPRSNDNIGLWFPISVGRLSLLSLFSDGTTAIQGVCSALSTCSLV